jgi:hypothetical protein
VGEEVGLALVEAQRFGQRIGDVRADVEAGRKPFVDHIAEAKIVRTRLMLCSERKTRSP